MNYEELKAQLTQADELNNKGKHEEAEILANTVLAELNIPSPSIPGERHGETEADNRGARKEASRSEEEELHCSALVTLSASNWRRGDYLPALDLALASVNVAEEHTIPELKAKAHGNIGIVYNALSNHAQALESLQKSLTIYQELNHKQGIAGNFGNLGLVYQNFSDYAKALECHQKSLAIHEELGNKIAVALNLGNIGLVYCNLSDYTNALEYMQKALAINEELGSKNGIALNLGNIGLVYNYLANITKALEYMQKALAMYEEFGSKSGMALNLGNIGSMYNELLDYTKALEYHQKALAIYEELGSKSGIANNLGNIGYVYQNLLDYAQALEYHQQALTIYEELGSKDGIALNLGNIGIVFAARTFDSYDPQRAEEYLCKAIAISSETGSKTLEYRCNKSLAELYKDEKRWEEAFAYLERYISLEKEVHIEEAKNQANLMEQRRQAEEREKEIAIAKATADAKHQATELLLHNVLPPSIANKMLDGTKLIAEKLPSVSVMFADIVNFTKLSQRITPEELVEGLDRIFSTFDALAEKHGLEKIKTIGDAYMVVSGAPVQREDHAEAMAHFALEMVDAMKEFRSISTGEEIQLRIGIHSGEVVAGVIGKKKFAYDLWGDAVNTASRMESHGEPGKIHVSEEFMRALSPLSPMSPMSPMSLQFVERGEMDIKGKGMMKTYFLENV